MCKITATPDLAPGATHVKSLVGLMVYNYLHAFTIGLASVTTYVKSPIELKGVKLFTCVNILCKSDFDNYNP